MSKRHERTRARRTVLQVLYSGELTEQSPTTLMETGMVLEQKDQLMSEYARKLIRGIESHSLGIDQQLKEASANWAVDRMPIVDRCILRLAVFEMLYVDEVPISVSINEAVELAKEFGGEDESPRFVNGVLGSVARKIAPDVVLDENAVEEEVDGE